MATSLPTDRFILKCIYEMCKGDYPGAPKQGGGFENDPYLPIDVRAVAEKLNMTPELLFGRLYYDLDNKHKYEVDGKPSTHLFAPKLGDRKHCVNFPYLSAILAGLDQEFRHRLIAYGMSTFAIAVSLAAMAVNLFTRH